MDDDTLDTVYTGHLAALPRLTSKLVRIFTSSTFTDMLMERNTLMEFVYPRIKEYCRDRYGVEFQVVDMRWGVRDEMTNEHMTTELCMRELRSCQELSIGECPCLDRLPGPNFIYLGGQKYGYRPLPPTIDTAELALLRDTLVAMGNSVNLLDRSTSPSNLLRWYKADINNVPAQSILQPITSILPNFLNKKEPSLQAEAAASWWVVQSSIQVTGRGSTWPRACSGRRPGRSSTAGSSPRSRHTITTCPLQRGRWAAPTGWLSSLSPRLSEGA